METILLDSNIIIYAFKQEYRKLFQYINSYKVSVSKITYLEVLGYHKLTDFDKNLLEIFFANIISYDINDDVIFKAIDLRQSKRMSIGDSIVAASAIINNIPLYTRNITDFQGIPNLSVVDPFEFI